MLSNMNDVARIAGVSRGSVSNYINGQKTRPDTQIKIEKAIKSLNYVPNATARALKTSRSNYVIFIIPTVNTPFFSELSYHVQLELKKFGYKMILCNSNSEPTEELEYIQMANTQKVAGIITMSYADVADLVSPNIALVSIEKKISDNFPMVISDNYQGGKLAAQKLHDSGAKHLLFASKSPIKDISSVRQQGFVDYCTENNLTYDTFLSRDIPNFIDDFKDFILENKTDHAFKYDGVFSDSDEYANAFWHILLQYDISVPGNVQIIGFDAARIYQRQPTFLSAIRQPIEKIASEAVTRLLLQLPHPEQHSQKNSVTVLPVTFQQGVTTKTDRH